MNKESLLYQRQKEKEENELRYENHRKMEKILAMLGTEEARSRFKKLIDAYFESYRAQKYENIAGAQEKEKYRAISHNNVMDTLQRLSLVSKPNSPEENLLKTLGTRDAVHKLINDYKETEADFRKTAADKQKEPAN